jgi:hypothetical protein
VKLFYESNIEFEKMEMQFNSEKSALMEEVNVAKAETEENCKLFR